MAQPIKQALCLLLAGTLLLATCPASAETGKTGDLNGDGVINSFDQRLLLQAQGTGNSPCDLNGDGTVDTADADLLWKLALGALTPAELPLQTTTAPSGTSGSSATAGSNTTTTTTKGRTSKTATTTTTKTTTKSTTKTTTTTTTKAPTTTTTAPSSGSTTAQARPTLTKVTAAANNPTVKTSAVKDSTAYTLKVKCSTGTVYDNSTKDNLQKMLAYIVKNEMGTAKFATNSTEAWKAQAVAAYTHLIYSYNNKTYVYGSKELNLNDSTDKKIYNAVGEVLGVKMLDSAGRAICAYYYGSAAGTTRNSQTVTQLAYIQPVFSPETDELCKKYGYSGLYSTVTYTLNEIKSKIGAKISQTVLAEETAGCYPLYARSWTGAYIDKSNLYYMSGSNKVYITGRQIREILGLRSASLVVTGMSGDTMTISVMGHGHGMGFSQIGAAIYANEYGWNYRQILAHYFCYSSGSWQLYGMNW